MDLSGGILDDSNAPSLFWLFEEGFLSSSSESSSEPESDSTESVESESDSSSLSQSSVFLGLITRMP